MKAKEIQDLIDFIAKSGLDEVNIETESFKLNVKRSGAISKAGEGIALPVQSFVPAPLPLAAPLQIPATAAPVPAAESPSAAGNTVTVRSPMIGTFYRSSNPETPALASVGDDIKKGQVLCIIEAMKLFNEIESEISGRIVKVLVENATPVEYDQPLFIVETN